MYIPNIIRDFDRAFEWCGYIGGWVMSVSEMTMNTFFNVLSSFWTNPWFTNSVNLYTGESIVVKFGISSTSGYTSVFTTIVGSFWSVVVDFFRDMYVSFGFSLSLQSWLGCLLFITFISFLFGCIRMIIRVFRH